MCAKHHLFDIINYLILRGFDVHIFLCEGAQFPVQERVVFYAPDVGRLWKISTLSANCMEKLKKKLDNSNHNK
jgi:hypothetical protein